MMNHQASATLPNGLPAPPVPQGLREMLKDYPGHIERLQQALNWVIEHPAKGVPAFERALWALEGRLETFISEARDELDAAEASGDAEAVLRAKNKVQFMFSCRSSSGWAAGNLMDYFGFPRATVHHGE